MRLLGAALLDFLPPEGNGKINLKFSVPFCVRKSVPIAGNGFVGCNA
mgnify:CR=1 FL=1